MPATTSVPEVLLLAGILALVALLLHKQIRIHRMLFRVADDAAATRRETESLFAQIQALGALTQLLQLRLPLPPLRGWAGSPDFLLATYHAARERQPTAALECSSGSSTLVLARALQQNGHGHVWSLEHDARFAEQTRALLRQHGLADWATVLHAPLQSTHTATPWYREEALPAEMPPVGLLVVDGPPAAVAPRARAPALPRLLPRLGAACTVLVDDADREDEAAMVAAWTQAHPGWNVTRIAAEKGLLRLDRGAQDAESGG